MKDKLELAIIIIIGAAALFLIADNRRLRDERDLYKTKIEHDFQSKYTSLQQQLRESEQQRTILIDSLNTRNIHIQNLSRITDSLNVQLTAVKGRYNKLTSSEKAREMERRAQ